MLSESGTDLSWSATGLCFLQKLTPGPVIELEIGLYAMDMEFEEGESLSVQVPGQYPLVDEFKGRGLEKPQVE